MINESELDKELELLHEYTLGAHHASDNENASTVLHSICHRLSDIRNNIKLGGKYYCSAGGNGA